MNYVVAFSGKARAGKTTSKDMLINYIEKNLSNYYVKQLSFATKLKQIVQELFGWNGVDKEIYFKHTETEIISGRPGTLPVVSFQTEIIPDKGRMLLINVGQKMREIRASVWVDFVTGIIKDYFAAKNTMNIIFVIDDARYLNEIEELSKIDGVFIPIRIERPTIDTIDDSSEKGLDDYDKWYSVIQNDGTLNDLNTKLIEMIKPLLVKEND